MHFHQRQSKSTLGVLTLIVEITVITSFQKMLIYNTKKIKNIAQILSTKCIQIIRFYMRGKERGWEDHRLSLVLFMRPECVVTE